MVNTLFVLKPNLLFIHTKINIIFNFIVFLWSSVIDFELIYHFPLNEKLKC